MFHPEPVLGNMFPDRSSMENNIKLLKLFNFFCDFKLYAPVAIIYFSQVSHSYALGASIFSITMISDALFELPTGYYSDRIGRKKSIALGASFATIAGIFYAIGHSYWILAIGAFIDGISTALYAGNNNALLYDSLSEKGESDQYHQYLGTTSALFQIALAVSAILGGLVANQSFKLMMWLSVIPQFICFLISFRFSEPRLHTEKSKSMIIHLKESIRLFLTNLQLRRLSIANMIGFGLGETMFQFQAAFYQTLWPLWAIGIAKTFSNIGAAFSFHFSGILIKKMKPIEWLITTNLYNRVINSSALLFPTVYSPLLMSSTSLFFGIETVSKSTLFQREYSEKYRATMGSFNSLLASLSFAVIAFIIGLFADRIGPAKSMLIIQFFSLSMLGIYIMVYREEKKSAE